MGKNYGPEDGVERDWQAMARKLESMAKRNDIDLWTVTLPILKQK